jgi:hypothetical protein
MGHALAGAYASGTAGGGAAPGQGPCGLSALRTRCRCLSVCLAAQGYGHGALDLRRQRGCDLARRDVLVVEAPAAAAARVLHQLVVS